MIQRRIAALALTLAVLAAGASPARAQMLKLKSTVFDNQKTPILEELSFSADLRLRQETAFYTRSAAKHRQRQRLRLRMGAEAKLLYDLRVGMRLATGAGSQSSGNQSFDNFGSQKTVSLDRAYLKYAPYVSDDGAFFLSAGKIANPFWTPESAELIWDGDFSPEGAAEGVEWFVPYLGGFIGFANALQMTVDEDSGSTLDQYLLSQQIGAEVRLPVRSRLRFAAAYHHWINETASTFGAVTAHEGNRRTGGVLDNEFGVLEGSAEFGTWIGAFPVSLIGTWARNAMINDENVGFQAGVRLGKATVSKTWEAAWFFKQVETDATVADLADSDFGDGGTNRKGHIAWLAFNPTDWTQFKLKGFFTQVLNEALAPGADDIDRVQLDFALKF